MLLGTIPILPLLIEWLSLTDWSVYVPYYALLKAVAEQVAVRAATEKPSAAADVWAMVERDSLRCAWPDLYHGGIVYSHYPA